MSANSSKGLTHVDEHQRPSMVDVSDKAITERSAAAETTVWLPSEVIEALSDEKGELTSKKGPVFASATIAGVMAAKKTHDLIPFCHPLGLTGCDVDITLDDQIVTVVCRCRVRHRTGVEMEALTGASVAALTIYDMCKAVSHNIEIRRTRLIAKTGGKHDYCADDHG